MNTLVTAERISKLALALLHGRQIAYTLTRDPGREQELVDDPKSGGKVKLVKRHIVQPGVYDGNNDPPAKDVTEGTVEIEIDGHLATPVNLPAKQQTFELNDFQTQIVEPVVLGFGEFINAFILSKARDVPFWSGVPGEATDTVKKVMALHDVLDYNKAPMGERVAILGPAARTSVFSIEAFHHANKRGDGGRALRDASIGLGVTGFDWYTTQHVLFHEAGSMSASTPLVSGAVAEGSTSMNLDGGAGTETLRHGDLFTVAGVVDEHGNPRQYVVRPAPNWVPSTEEFIHLTPYEYVAALGAINNVQFYPAAPAGGFPDNAAVTVLATHTKNLHFAPGAIVSAVIPSAPRRGAGESAHFFDPKYGGITVSFGTAGSMQQDQVLFDCYLASKVVDPRLAVVQVS